MKNNVCTLQALSGQSCRVEEPRQVVRPCGVQLPPQDSQADGNGNPGERLREEV